MALPPRADGTELRLLATNDMLGAVVPLPTTFGASGTVHGVAALLDEQLGGGPAIWLDSGDFSLGGPAALFGGVALDDLATLPIAAAAAGNHEFDGGADAAAAVAARVGFPLLCADRDAGLPAHALVETPAGAVGVIGITHPEAHRLAQAPPPAAAAADIVPEFAALLRRDGARWVVALLHDGVTWWPDADGSVRTRAERLSRDVGPWAAHVDLILGGHTLSAWTGSTSGAPAGHAHPFATTVLAVDLRAPGTRAAIHPPARVPAISGPAAGAFDAAAQAVVGHLDATWTSRPGVDAYLPDLVARALRDATGAGAGFVPASQLFTQAPLDGAVAALRAGPVTELDVLRLFPFPDDALAVVELHVGELERLRAAHDAATDPRNAAADADWWNWARLPAGVSAADANAETIAVDVYFTPLLASFLGREPASRPAGVGGRNALVAALQG